MRDFIHSIETGDALTASNIFMEKMYSRIEEILEDTKIRLAHEMFEPIDETVVQKMGRVKRVNARIRNGKLQRKKTLSTAKGYTMRGGHLTRMSAQERLHRKMAQRRSKYKRKIKMVQSLRKRRLSLIRRKAMVAQ